MSGRLAEINGEAALSTDFYVRALETERLSREEYDRAGPDFRAIADAWTAGLNHYLERHPGVVPRLIRRFEPWQMFAVAGRSESIWVPMVHGVFQTGEVGDAMDQLRPGVGSNMWMIGPSKAANGRAMLFINPHNAPETYLEGHLLSDEGLNVYGGNRPGRPLPVFGHTARHGWTMTNNGPESRAPGPRLHCPPLSETEMRGGGARTWRDAAAEKEGLLRRARPATAGAADEVQDRAFEMVRDVQGRTSEMADDVRDTVSEATQGAREPAAELAHRTARPKVAQAA